MRCVELTPCLYLIDTEASHVLEFLHAVLNVLVHSPLCYWLALLLLLLLSVI
jgi:hypothetical protein